MTAIASILRDATAIVLDYSVWQSLRVALLIIALINYLPSNKLGEFLSLDSVMDSQVRMIHLTRRLVGRLRGKDFLEHLEYLVLQQMNPVAKRVSLGLFSTKNIENDYMAEDTIRKAKTIQ